MKFLPTTIYPLCLLYCGTVSALGFDNNVIGARSWAMGGAFVGVADDASSVYHNPAGLTNIAAGSIDSEIYANISFSDFRYRNAGGQTARSDEIAMTPGMFVAKTDQTLSYGLGIYVPHGGGGVRYDSPATNGAFDYAFGLIALTPAVGYRLSPGVAVGIGVPLMLGVQKQKVNNYEAEYSGLAGYGIDLGGMFQLTKATSLGITYRTPRNIRMDGEVKIAGQVIDESAKVKFTIPDSLTIGLGYRPSPSVLIAADLAYRRWSKLDKVEFRTAGSTNFSATHFKDDYAVKFGIEHRASENLELRAGLNYYRTALRDQDVSYQNIETNLIFTSLGLGYRLSSGMKLNASISYGNAVKRKNTQGEYDSDSVSILLGASKIF